MIKITGPGLCAIPVIIPLETPRKRPNASTKTSQITQKECAKAATTRATMSTAHLALTQNKSQRKKTRQ